MNRISTIMYEISIEELVELPDGFQILRYNIETDSYALLTYGISEIDISRKYKYYLLKEPPITFGAIENTPT